jgi:hypothetical protein
MKNQLASGKIHQTNPNQPTPTSKNTAPHPTILEPSSPTRIFSANDARMTVTPAATAATSQQALSTHCIRVHVSEMCTIMFMLPFLPSSRESKSM